MLKLEQDLLGHILRASDTAFHQQEELRRLTRDIGDLEQRISDQITLIRVLAWEAQDAASAKEAFQKMQETLTVTYCSRSRRRSRNQPEVRALPAIIDAQEGSHARQEASSSVRLHRARRSLLRAACCHCRPAASERRVVAISSHCSAIQADLTVRASAEV